MPVNYHFGSVFDRDTITIFVRPSRYTFQLLKEAKYFSLNFLEKRYKKLMAETGSISGAIINKFEHYSLITLPGPFDTLYSKIHHGLFSVNPFTSIP